MYTKDLCEDFRLRLTKKDMDFLRGLSEERGQSVSECVRAISGEYRRSLETLSALNKAWELVKEETAVHGNTKTNINNKLQ